MAEETKEVRMEETLITDDMIEEMRSRIGLKLRIEKSIFNEEATKMAILKFADGIGDANSLWRDAEYAQNTAYGRLVAPPSWIFSVFTGQQSGWRGLGGFHSASEIEFYKPIFINDKIVPECMYMGFDGPEPSKFAGKMIKDYFENRYYNQRNELIAKANRLIIRTERGKAKKMGKYVILYFRTHGLKDELTRIEEEVLSEKIRGADIRYWEDVKIGEELKPIVRAPWFIRYDSLYCRGRGTNT